MRDLEMEKNEAPHRRHQTPSLLIGVTVSPNIYRDKQQQQKQKKRIRTHVH